MVRTPKQRLVTYRWVMGKSLPNQPPQCRHLLLTPFVALRHYRCRLPIKVREIPRHGHGTLETDKLVPGSTRNISTHDRAPTPSLSERSTQRALPLRLNKDSSPSLKKAHPLLRLSLHRGQHSIQIKYPAVFHSPFHSPMKVPATQVHMHGRLVTGHLQRKQTPHMPTQNQADTRSRWK